MHYFGGHNVFVVGSMIPLFWTSGDLFSGFQSVALFTLIGGVRDIHSLKFISGVAPADLLADMAAIGFPTCLFQQRIRLGDFLHSSQTC